MKWTALLTVCVGALISGCSSLQYSDVDAAGSSDEEIVAEVTDRLSSDTVTQKYNVSVTSEERIVTLSGSVPDQNARARAISIARGSSGVQGVVDNFYKH